MRSRSLTESEYKFIAKIWTSPDYGDYQAVAEQCFAEGWIDARGDVTQKGSAAMAIYVSFHGEPSDDELDDKIPWDDEIPFMGGVITADDISYLDIPAIKAKANLPAIVDEPKFSVSLFRGGKSTASTEFA